MSGKHRSSIKFSQGWSTPRVAKADHPGDPAPDLNHLRNHHHPGDLVASPEPEALWKPLPSENTLLFNVKWTLLRIPSLMPATHVAFCDSSVLRWCIALSIRCVALCCTEHHTACTCLELCFWSPPVCTPVTIGSSAARGKRSSQLPGPGVEQEEDPGESQKRWS